MTKPDLMTLKSETGSWYLAEDQFCTEGQKLSGDTFFEVEENGEAVTSCSLRSARIAFGSPFSFVWFRVFRGRK